MAQIRPKFKSGEAPMPLNLAQIRAQFPSLNRPAIFFDNPGGTQIAIQSAERIHRYLMECNANHGGAFQTSRDSDAILDEAHAAMADFLNAARPEEIIFGANMTTLTLHISRSLARQWQSGDSILVTRLDHDANVSPWVLAAQDRGVDVIMVDMDVEDCSVSLEDFARGLERKPKLAAFGYASNAFGTISPVRKMVKMAHESGALTYIDAVQYAPHGPIDVQNLATDFLVCSGYKFFGPHSGMLYGRYDLLEELTAYKVRPATNSLPGKFETGTQNHECIAGVLGSLEYFEWLGREFGAAQASALKDDGFEGRRLELKKALVAIRAYEFELSRALLENLQAMPGVQIYGIADSMRLDERVPTISFRVANRHPEEIALALGERGIYLWSGNYYALESTLRLGVEESGGMVRVGAAHYNTLEEIAQFGEVLREIVG
jgi:cysteine desulfurase family protein (TIGR01976 family)